MIITEKTVTGYSEKLDSQNRALAIKCTEDGQVWGYISENNHRISDSQFDVARVEKDEDWTQVARDFLRYAKKCYQVEVKEVKNVW